MNSVFRVYRYPLNYSAFTGKDLTPGNVIERSPSGIEEQGSGWPSFRLDHNYPNPFCGSTTVGFQIFETCQVKLAVTDLYGRNILILINENMSPGNYQIQVDAENLRPGIYFYQLSCDGYSETKRMVVLR